MSALKTGAKGKAVRSLQQALLFAGTLYSTQISGTYDEATATAVRKFQKKAGLRSDGVATPETMRRLSRVIARGKAPITPQPDFKPFLGREKTAFESYDTRHRRMLGFCRALPGKEFDALAAEITANRKAHRAAYLSWQDRANAIVKLQAKVDKLEVTDVENAQYTHRKIDTLAQDAHKDWHTKRRHVIKLQELLNRYEELRMERV